MLRAGLIAFSLLSAAISSAAPAAKPFARQPQIRGRVAPSAPIPDVHPLYARTRSAAMKAEAARLNPRGKVRRVFYPMGASDIATAISLFEGPHGGPSEIVIADILPFGAPKETAEVHADLARKQAYMGGGNGRPRQVHDDAYIDVADFLRLTKLTGPAILWELEQLGAKNVSVRHLDAEGAYRATVPEPREARVGGYSFNWAKNKPDFYDPQDRDVVRLRFELNGVPRSILYVQHDMLDAHAPAVLKKALAHGFDAYLEKAPIGVTFLPEYQANRSQWLRSLNKKHGIFLTDGVESVEAVTSEARQHGYGFLVEGGPRYGILSQALFGP